MAKLRINPEGFHRACTRARLNTNSSIARHMGIDPATVSRVVNNAAEPGNRFIAGAAKAFGTAWFTEIFTITDS